MGRKKFFSLIEIAVAMAVAAIGVAAIMALLPVALKSTSDSVGDTLAADAANTVFAQLDRVAWEHFDWIQGLPKGKPLDSKAFSKAERETYAAKKMGAESYLIEPASGLQDGHFAFIFGPPNQPNDFAAEVFCWIESDTKLRLTRMRSTGKQDNNFMVPKNEAGKPALVRVHVEITWPIAKPYLTNKLYPRQSRTFVRDYFDPTYSLFSTD